MDILNKSALTDMAASVLRPLIKVLTRNEFTHSDLTELVRRTYVEVAYDGFALPNKKMTYSRAAILTGLSRKEVVRLYSDILRCEAEQKSPRHHMQTQAMRLIHGWLADLDYIDGDKKPIEIAIDNNEISFSNLVNKHCENISSSKLLDELNRLGITSQTSLDTIKLVRTGLAHQHDEFEKIRVMSVCVSDLFTTAVHSSDEHAGDIRFERQLVYSGIEEKIAHRFHEAGSQKAMALFDTLNDFLSTDNGRSDSLANKSGRRVGLGIYYFEGASQVKSVKMMSEEHA